MRGHDLASTLHIELVEPRQRTATNRPIAAHRISADHASATACGSASRSLPAEASNRSWVRLKDSSRIASRVSPTANTGASAHRSATADRSAARIVWRRASSRPSSNDRRGARDQMKSRALGRPPPNPPPAPHRRCGAHFTARAPSRVPAAPRPRPWPRPRAGCDRRRGPAWGVPAAAQIAPRRGRRA